MRKILVLVVALASFAAVANAGVVRESFKVSKFAAKHSYRGAKKAARYSVKAGKVAGKVLY